MRVEKSDYFDIESASEVSSNPLHSVSEKFNFSLSYPLQILCLTPPSAQDDSAFKSILQNTALGAIYVANTLEAGLSYLGQHQVDVILIFRSLSGLTQAQTIAQLKSQAEIPILILLEQEHIEAVQAVFAAGAQDYLMLGSVAQTPLATYALQHAVLRHRALHVTAETPQHSSGDQVEQIQRQYLSEVKTWRHRYELAGLLSGQILFQWDILNDQPLWGPNTEQIFGWTAAEMPNSFDEWVNLIHPEDQAMFMSEMDGGLKQKNPISLEYRIQRKDGTYIWVEDRMQLLLDPEGSPQRLLGFISDITHHKQTAAALEESETKFRLLSELAPIGIFLTDLEGQTLYENPYLKAMDCSQDPAALEQDWIALIHPDDREQTIKSFQQFVLTQSTWLSEFRILNVQGQSLWMLAQARPIRLGNVLSGYMGTITDISKQKNAETALQALNQQLEAHVAEQTYSLQQANLKLRIENAVRKRHVDERRRIEQALSDAKDHLQAVLDAVPGFVAWVGADLRFLGVNQLMAETFGRTTEAFIGQTVDFLQQEFEGIVPFVQNFIFSKEDSVTEEFELLVNKDACYYLAIAQRYLQGEAAVFVILDITNRKRAELEVFTALQKSQELSELKSRFISIASHEFRTPLTTIFSASELLEHYGERWPRAKELLYIRQIQGSVKHMTGLLDDVLLISAEEAGKLKFEPVTLNVVEFCQILTEEFKFAKDCDHTIHFISRAETQDIKVDEKLLRHILSNLLSNAVKYSPKQKPIEFLLEVTPESAIFSVTDQGIGIPFKDQQHLFELFHRATNVGTIAGTGLGLSIVKKAVTLHGGTIDVKSEVGVGTQFTVSIPVKQSRGEYQW